MGSALVLGMKTQSRRPLTEGNSVLTRGRFAQIDWASGRPDGLWPISCLKVRMVTESGRRSVTLCPRLRANAWVWVRIGQAGERARKANASHLLRIRTVRACRLNDISEADAKAEGLEVFGPTPEAAYATLLAQMGKVRAARWRRSQTHVELAGAPTWRACFATLWELLGGKGAWASNPWVWVYSFAQEQVAVL